MDECDINLRFFVAIMAIVTLLAFIATVDFLCRTRDEIGEMKRDLRCLQIQIETKEKIMEQLKK